MFINITKCPVCQGTKFDQYIKTKDHTVSQQEFDIIQCTHCDMLITSPQPDPEDLHRYYLSEEYISHAERANSLFDYVYHAARRFTLNWKYQIILRHSQETKRLNILDYGCGTGDFLAKCKKHNHQVSGVEPSFEARSIATRKTGIKISPILISEPSSHDIITLWHVLEHIPQLSEILQQLHNCLRKNGTIFIAVPNPASADATHYGSNWAAYDTPRHLWHFFSRTMQQLLENQGLTVATVLPMRLDAYYVSLLSEKYRHGHLGIKGLLSALAQAGQSNLKARKNNNYSSLIYVVKKR